jgi:hypothetical protein
MGSNNQNRNIVKDENYSTLTNHSKTNVYNTLTSCYQLRIIKIKEKMRNNYCIDTEVINTFYSTLCIVSFRVKP